MVSGVLASADGRKSFIHYEEPQQLSCGHRLIWNAARPQKAATKLLVAISDAVQGGAFNDVSVQDLPVGFCPRTRVASGKLSTKYFLATMPLRQAGRVQEFANINNVVMPVMVVEECHARIKHIGMRCLSPAAPSAANFTIRMGLQDAKGRVECAGDRYARSQACQESRNSQLSCTSSMKPIPCLDLDWSQCRSLACCSRRACYVLVAFVALRIA